MAISEWPETERPRERLLSQGATNLTDSELLAIFLRTGVKGKNAVELARGLLERFGDLRALCNASVEEFCQSKGLGIATFVQIQAVLELSKRYFLAELRRGDSLNSPELVHHYLCSELQDMTEEVFAVLFMDGQNRVIRFEKLFHGTVDSAVVYPRVVLRRIIELNATAVILSHNHPSGNPEPSVADVSLTRKIANALHYIDVKVLDHIIVGANSFVSFSERGLL